ncbi:unnamed protein product [Mesocestoides corti]|uniref:Uncharacterized protein n=1 Tax=Mesocestoides corti TaxID=53468 RepID=A0A3P6HEG7_MESCO|nr:unnamed protein product [Mesocestoides corti]
MCRQKTCYQQSYEWLLAVHRSRRRARYPWIPREPATSCVVNGLVKEIPEMRVEFVVPENLESCDLKPYVAWQADVIHEPPLTSEGLFEQRYGDQIRRLHEEGKSREMILSEL